MPPPGAMSEDELQDNLTEPQTVDLYRGIVGGSLSKSLNIPSVGLIPPNTNMQTACKEGRGNSYIHATPDVKRDDMEFLVKAREGLSEFPEKGTPEREAHMADVRGYFALVEEQNIKGYEEWEKAQAAKRKALKEEEKKFEAIRKENEAELVSAVQAIAPKPELNSPQIREDQSTVPPKKKRQA